MRERGFTLMELIGVMAVLAILSAAMAPSIFAAVDDAYSAAEDSNLQALADDLENYLLTRRSLPRASRPEWSAALATVSDRPVSAVLSNRRNFQRTLYYDPRFFSTSDVSFPGFVQTTGLAAAPVSPRLMLISNTRANAPQPAMNSATFNAIWNQDPGAAVVESSDVKIVRLNLGRHFQRVLMTNSAPALTGYSLDGGVSAAIAANNGTTDGVLERYVITGTTLRLFSDPYPSGTLATAILVGTPIGLRYLSNGAAWFWEST